MAHKAFADQGLAIHVISRGILVTFPSPANEHSMDIVRKDYPKIEDHVATAFDEREIDADTTVLTMTERHKQYLIMHYPELRSKIWTFMEYVSRTGDIHDPYGGSREVYDKCAHQIRELTQQLIIKIQNPEESGKS